MLTCNLEGYILEKIKSYIPQLPKDIYVLYYLIHVNEEGHDIPTLSLCFNTLSKLSNKKIDSDEACWNIAYWDTDEIPIIGNNFKITDESMKTTKMLKDWFDSNNCDYSKFEKDPLDSYYNYTVGYRVLSELVQKITPNVKEMLKKVHGSNVICLVGDFSFLPIDVERITAMNGTETMPFLRYYEDSIQNNSIEFSHDDAEGCDVVREFAHGAIEFFEKLKNDYKSEKEKNDQLDESIEYFKKIL